MHSILKFRVWLEYQLMQALIFEHGGLTDVKQSHSKWKSLSPITMNLTACHYYCICLPLSGYKALYIVLLFSWWKCIQLHCIVTIQEHMKIILVMCNSGENSIITMWKYVCTEFLHQSSQLIYEYDYFIFVVKSSLNFFQVSDLSIFCICCCSCLQHWLLASCKGGLVINWNNMIVQLQYDDLDVKRQTIKIIVLCVINRAHS